MVEQRFSKTEKSKIEWKFSFVAACSSLNTKIHFYQQPKEKKNLCPETSADNFSVHEDSSSVLVQSVQQEESVSVQQEESASVQQEESVSIQQEESIG